MKPTTAQRFGSLGKSFGAPAAAAAVIGAALLASDTSDTSETAWSPAAACLLPDVLPVAGTLLSYGGNRQLAAGGTVTHNGGITASGYVRADEYLAVGLSGVNAIYANYQGRVSVINTGYFGIGSGDAAGSLADVVLGRDSVNVWGMYTSSAMSSFAGLKVGAITASGVMTVNGVTLTGNSSYGLLYSSASIVAEGFWASSGSNKVWVSSAYGTRVASDLGFQFGSNTEVSNPPDLQLTRQSAGVLQIGTTTANASGSLLLTNITASGAIQETPTQSALDPTTTNIPSGKRQGWYNSTLSEFRDWVNIGGTLLKSAAYT